MRASMIICIGALVVGVALCQTADSSSNSGAGENVLPLDGACTDPRGAAGRCVQFQECEYSTDHIDLRLYRPRNYTSECVSAEICCPLQYVTTKTAQANYNSTQWDNFK